jgi:hypothetical protein
MRQLFRFDTLVALNVLFFDTNRRKIGRMKSGETAKQGGIPRILGNRSLQVQIPRQTALASRLLRITKKFRQSELFRYISPSEEPTTPNPPGYLPSGQEFALYEAAKLIT